MNSQVGQDNWICEKYNYKKNGIFLDVGAFDGVQISNTYYLESVLGWKGYCIEAGIKNYSELIKKREYCLHAAVCGKTGVVQFEENWTVGKIGSGDPVQSFTFADLLKYLDYPNEIDYISLDIEGSEYEALLTFPFEKYKVGAWTVEHNSHEDGGVMRDKIRQLMKVNGYTLYEGNLKPEAAIFEDWYVN